ncbi:MAG: hypothetical protein GXO43_06905 [Crenarchaeota archaeon]|nr:hypothetical protein [Thermoproteota archaeon]
MRGISRAEKIANDILSKYNGGFVSRRDGQVIIKIVRDNRNIIVWIRQRPITRKALSLFKKIIAKHEYDELVLLKLYDSADYIRYDELSFFNKIIDENNIVF